MSSREWKPQPAPERTNSAEVWPLIIEDVKRGRYDVVEESDGEEGSTALGWTAAEGEKLLGLFAARHQYGLKKYGTGLQVWNGREPLQDLLDEAVDAVAYSRQLYEQTKATADWELHLQAMRLAAAVVARLRAVPE